MKNKLLAVLLCGVMLAGCGKEMGENPIEGGTGENVEIVNSGEPEDGQKEGQEDMHREQQKEQVSYEPTETGGMYDRAAYLTDMVYQSNGSENTMVSPLSLDMALGLVSGGAAGATKEELLGYLDREDYGSFAAAYMTYVEKLNYDNSGQAEHSGYKTVFEIANSLWVRDDRKLAENYEENAREQYRAEIASVSFAPEQADNTAGRINSWCNEKTHELIPSIITPDAITEDMAAILINSLYFESPWWESWNQSEHIFTDIDGKESKQEMLIDTLKCYYENEHATAFSKDYQNGLQFIGILPKETGEFELRDMDVESLLESRETGYDVIARMPKLNFDTTAKNIVPILQAQGVESVFSKTESDLSGLIETDAEERVYISDIIQKCKIELDEDGTRAAAATAIIMNQMSLMKPEPREQKEVFLDRPFAFMIYDSENEQIVFMGKVVRVD